MSGSRQAYLLVFSALAFCDAKILKIEAETTQSTLPKHYRSNASGYQTVWMHRYDTLKYNFCLIRTTTITINDVRISNDGDSDTCEVSFNGNLVGSFQSSAASNYGYLWNFFKSTHTIGQSFVLNTGLNEVSIHLAVADNYGIEIDKIEFSVSDEELNDEILSCELTCMGNLPSVVTEKPNLVTGKAVQKSYPTQCAEEDNVNVAVFNTAVKTFKIIATPQPQYLSFPNLRDENTQKCPFLTPVYWMYENVLVSPSSGTLTSNTSHLYFSENPATTPYFMTKMAVTFTLKGRSIGSIDSEIGSVIFMTVEAPATPINVTVSYEHRNGNTIGFPLVVFTEAHTSHYWNISDFTWKEDLLNHIFIFVESTVINPVINFRMERRYMSADQVSTIYSSDLIIIEAITIDFWWQAPESMQIVRPSTLETWNNIAYFRIYYTPPWTDGFTQVFVLYQDGNMRLLYPSPPEFDWIPFGTSVIIGQTNVNDFRPAVSIVKVEIEPDDLTMVVTYHDGNKVSMRVDPEINQTTLYVYDLEFYKDTAIHPFATFRSMYVETGNSDSDSLVSDASTTQQILGGTWTEINGTTFFLYRRCQSKHLTQSPDIKLIVTET